MITLPQTNKSPLKMVVSNRNLLVQNSIFGGELLVSGRVFFVGASWGILGSYSMATLSEKGIRSNAV